MSKITFIMPIYNPKKIEIEYWSSIYKDLISDGHEFFIVNDGGDELIESYFELEKISYLKNEKNKGKYHSVVSCILKSKNKFIKVIDPDDYISINLVKEIASSLTDEAVYIFKPSRIKGSLSDITQKNIETIITKKEEKKHRNSLGNSWTILPKKPFLDKGRISKRRIDYNDDQLLGQICLSKGMEIKRIYLPFYLYVVENGISSPKNISDYIIKLENTINEYIRLKKIYSYENTLNWPNFNYYRKLVTKSKLKLKEKRFLKKKILKLKEKVEKKNEKKN